MKTRENGIVKSEKSGMRRTKKRYKGGKQRTDDAPLPSTTIVLYEFKPRENFGLRDKNHTKSSITTTTALRDSARGQCDITKFSSLLFFLAEHTRSPYSTVTTRRARDEHFC